MSVEDRRVIEIEFCRFRECWQAEFLGMVRLYPMAGGIGAYARDAQPHGEHDFRQVRGFVACDPDDNFWRLIAKAVAFAAGAMVT